MNLVLQQLPPTLRGSAKLKLLAPEAAASVLSLEKDIGLVYTSLWNDATATLLDKRTRIGTQLPGYDPHNFGVSMNLDVPAILDEKKISYQDLLYTLKRRGWLCHRRDGEVDQHGWSHFNYFGDGNPEEYLSKASFDPLSWDNPIEARIYEKHSQEFTLSPAQGQGLLQKLGFFHGEIDGNYDLYLREAILAFQRAWDLSESGTLTIPVQRTLAFVAATITTTS